MSDKTVNTESSPPAEEPRQEMKPSLDTEMRERERDKEWVRAREDWAERILIVCSVLMLLLQMHDAPIFYSENNLNLYLLIIMSNVSLLIIQIFRFIQKPPFYRNSDTQISEPVREARRQDRYLLTTTAFVGILFLVNVLSRIENDILRIEQRNELCKLVFSADNLYGSEQDLAWQSYALEQLDGHHCERQVREKIEEIEGLQQETLTLGSEGEQSSAETPTVQSVVMPSQLTAFPTTTIAPTETDVQDGSNETKEGQGEGRTSGIGLTTIIFSAIMLASISIALTLAWMRRRRSEERVRIRWLILTGVIIPLVAAVIQIWPSLFENIISDNQTTAPVSATVAATNVFGEVATQTPTTTPSITYTPTQSPSNTVENTPTLTQTPTPTVTSLPSESPSPSVTSTAQATKTPTPEGDK